LDIVMNAPQAAFVDRRHLVDDHATVSHLCAMFKRQRLTTRVAGQEFLPSSAFDRLKPEAMFPHLRQVLSL